MDTACLRRIDPGQYVLPRGGRVYFHKHKFREEEKLKQYSCHVGQHSAPASAFYRDHSRSTGLSSKCKEHSRVYVRRHQRKRRAAFYRARDAAKSLTPALRRQLATELQEAA